MSSTFITSFSASQSAVWIGALLVVSVSAFEPLISGEHACTKKSETPLSPASPTFNFSLPCTWSDFPIWIWELLPIFRLIEGRRIQYFVLVKEPRVLDKVTPWEMHSEWIRKFQITTSIKTANNVRTNDDEQGIFGTWTRFELSCGKGFILCSCRIQVLYSNNRETYLERFLAIIFYLWCRLGRKCRKKQERYAVRSWATHSNAVRCCHSCLNNEPKPDPVRSTKIKKLRDEM